jgi:hypothetical protein
MAVDDSASKKAKRKQLKAAAAAAAEAEAAEAASAKKKEKKEKKRKAKEPSPPVPSSDEEEKSSTSSEETAPAAKKVKKEKTKKNVEASPAASEDDGEITASSDEDPADPNALTNFRISEQLKQRLKSKGIKALFPIQATTFDLVLDGSDLVGRARTGQVSGPFKFVIHSVDAHLLNCLDRAVPCTLNSNDRGSAMVTVLVGISVKSWYLFALDWNRGLLVVAFLFAA